MSYRYVGLLVRIDDQFEDPKAFVAEALTSVSKGDEDVAITIAGAEFFVEILDVREAT